MRSLIQHAVAILFIGFICKVALQAQSYQEFNGVPKSLLLGSISAEEPIPSRQIDAKKIIAAIRNDH